MVWESESFLDKSFNERFESNNYRIEEMQNKKINEKLAFRMQHDYTRTKSSNYFQHQRQQHQQHQQQQHQQRSEITCDLLQFRSLPKMFAMIIVITAAISGSTVHAALRDSTKPKDSKSLGNPANSIPNGISYGGGGGSTSNTNSGNSPNSVISSSSSSSSSTVSFVSSTTSATSSNGGGGSGGVRNAFEMIEEIRNGPYFDRAASKNVTALLGKTAYLNCRVKNLGNKTMLLQVSWVRHRDIHLLTVGRYTYTSDQRFRAIHQPQTEDWILQIKYPQHRDSGVYECQVSTTPHMSHYIHLTVVEPSTEIIGAPDLYIESGSTINLTCVILNSPEPPAYIFWNHNNAIINYDSPRGGVSVVTNKGDTTTSFLLIKSARPSDSGQYQCNPSNAKSKSVTVHVLNGEFPAAMQRAGQAHHRMSPSHYLLVYLSMCLSTLFFIKLYMRLPPTWHYI